jgi:hypothetical protein
LRNLRPLNPSQRSNSGFGFGGTFANAIPRHEISPPLELKPPEAITFSVEKVIKKLGDHELPPLAAYLARTFKI